MNIYLIESDPWCKCIVNSFEPQPLHNGKVCNPARTQEDVSQLSNSGTTRAGDGNGLPMVPYAHPLLMKWSNILYVLHIDVQAALDGYGASTTA
jgi:hypothetical protein